MNPPDSPLDVELDRLLGQARAQRVDTSAVEYGFETRLIARLKEKREPSSVWAMISWRMAPIFAVGMMALAIWQMETGVDTSDTTTLASFDNPEAADLWSDTTD